MKVFTLGHSTRRQEELIALLAEAGVARLVDVRAWPRSRRNPRFDAERLQRALREAGARRYPGRRFRAQDPDGSWGGNA